MLVVSFSLLVISDLCLFHFIALLNPDFSCSKNLLSSLVDKVTTGTYNFASFIWNVAFFWTFIASITGSALGFASPVALLVITIFRSGLNSIYFTVN